MADSKGSVYEVSFEGELRPLQMQAPITPDLQESVFAPLFKEIGEKFDFQNQSLKDGLLTLKQALIEGDINEAQYLGVKTKMQEAGYNALIDDGSQRLGVARNNHNAVTLLDEASVKQNKVYEPNDSVLKGPSQEAIDRAQGVYSDFKNHVLIDGDRFDQSMRELAELPQEMNYESKAFNEDMNNFFEDIKSLEKQKLLTAEDLNLVKALQDDFKNIELRHTLMKAASACVRG